MQLTGNKLLNASPARVYGMLMDPEVLAKIVPGVSSLEKLSENSYKSTLSLKIGPVGGSFSGNLHLEDIVPDKSFTLKAQQNSKIGNANAAVKIVLQEAANNQTEVSFDGDVRLSGVLATMGQRVVGGVANTLTKQFFNNLENELAAPEK